MDYTFRLFEHLLQAGCVLRKWRNVLLRDRHVSVIFMQFADVVCLFILRLWAYYKLSLFAMCSA